MKKKKFIAFGRPYIGNEEVNSVRNVVKSKWIGSGPVTERLSKNNFKIYKES